MTILPRSFQRTTGTTIRLSAGRTLALLAALLATLAIIFAGDQIERLGAYGYPAVLFISLLSNAALLLPAPGIAVVIAAGSTLDPLLVGAVAGLGAAIGEMTGYLVGQSGQMIVEDKPLYGRIERGMKKSSTLIIFFLATIPNPLFDVGGILAGALRMPVWRFLLTVWFGKSLRFALLATMGAMTL